jgi:phosphoglycolate phosphatase
LVGKRHADVLSAEAFWEIKRAKGTAGDVVRRCGLEESALAGYSKGWRERIESPEWLMKDTLFSGVREQLMHWKERHALVVVTLRQRGDLVRGQLKALGVLECFRNVLTANPLDGHGWDAKARLMAGDADYRSDAVVVGDTEMDIRAGKQLGLKTVGVLSGIRDREQLAVESPDWLIDRLVELPKILDLDEQ